MQNKAGNTPLHYAAMNGHLDAVKMLAGTQGVDWRVRNKAGWGAGDEAERGGGRAWWGIYLGWMGRGRGKERGWKGRWGLEGRVEREECDGYDRGRRWKRGGDKEAGRGVLVIGDGLASRYPLLRTNLPDYRFISYPKPIDAGKC